MACFRILAAVFTALILAIPMSARAQEPAKTFAVVPFSINGPDKYAYLSRGIQEMMISRLTWENHFQHIGKDKLSETKTPASDTLAEAARASVGSDYLVWGSVTILGDQCSVDVRTTGPDGTWPESDQTTISGLIPSLEKASKAINARVFKRPEATATVETKQTNRMNPELIHNETNPTEEFYINPQFRYQGGSETPGLWRSPSLPFVSRGMIVGDPDNDGVNEMFFIAENTVYAYRVADGKFDKLSEINPGGRTELLTIDLLDLDRDGNQEIIISGFYAERADSYILNFKAGKLVVSEAHIPLFLRVVDLPPLYQPTLVGQKVTETNVLVGNVHQVTKIGGKYALGTRVPLPEDSNVFNFTFLPTKDDEYKVLQVNTDDRIEVYTPRFDLQATTFDQFAGSAVGFEIPDTIKAFNTYKDQYINYYYIPLRMIICDLDGNGVNEILVNKDISTAAQFVQSYRFFPNGEIHSLFWDGVGVSLAWKTRRIKGSVTDYGLADIDNDGVQDLYVCLNTHPGAAGIKARKTTVTAYPLDISKTQGNVDRDAQ
ncbi:MAG: VCBS repeat-containing protein [Proteobacteria bacterium]|nr:VCBS repeat-containing protein [Pseudomonadota bacterium]